MIVRKCAFQAVDPLRFPSVCQIQHTAHTGKLFIVRSADRLFKKLLLPVWVRLRKREAQFGTACCCDLGKLRCMPVHTVDFCRLIGEKMGESLMKCVSIQSCQIVCTFQCGICRRIPRSAFCKGYSADYRFLILGNRAVDQHRDSEGFPAWKAVHPAKGFYAGLSDKPILPPYPPKDPCPKGIDGYI